MRMNFFSPRSSKIMRGEESSAFSSLMTPPAFLSLPPPFLAHGRRASSSSAVLSLIPGVAVLFSYPIFAAFPVPCLPRNYGSEGASSARWALLRCPFPSIFTTFPVPCLPGEGESEGTPPAWGALYPDVSPEEVDDFLAHCQP